jgi:hypothetical protein
MKEFLKKTAPGEDKITSSCTPKMLCEIYPIKTDICLSSPMHVFIDCSCWSFPTPAQMCKKPPGGDKELCGISHGFVLVLTSPYINEQPLSPNMSSSDLNSHAIRLISHFNVYYVLNRDRPAAVLRMLLSMLRSCSGWRLAQLRAKEEARDWYPARPTISAEKWLFL